MPDEALKASLQGRPRQAPDFSPLALSHLHNSCLAVRQLIKQYLNKPSVPQLESLSTAVKDIHHTLQLLDRQGALLVTSELSLLLDAMKVNRVEDEDACAHSLVFAGERLADYVAHLQRPGAVDSALPLLPVINNCRACRGEELLSEMLVVASGIDLPDASSLALPNTDEIDAFVGSIKASRQPLMRGLVGWFTDKSALQASLADLCSVFGRLSKSCDAPTSLQPLVPLFDSAEFICHSVQRGGLDNSAALHKLFAQLERLLDSYSKLDINDRASFAQPVPERLFLNMLYYVALSTETSSKAVALRRRFRLDRFISRGIASDRSQLVFDGVGDRLADSIRNAIELETEAARLWLSDDHGTADDLDKVRNRLSQLEPAITLLGAPESLRQLTLINGSLASLAETDGDFPPRTTDRIADALIRLERALDTELNAVRARASSSEHSDLESILAACLSEAQLRLLEIEDDLIVLFGGNELGQGSVEPNDQAKPGDPLKVAQVNAKLSMINSALQVLPLPEVSPLIGGVQAFILRHENQSLSRSAHRDLATVMVSLGYYLNSVLQPNGAAGQLLLEAEEALLKLDIEGLETNDDTLADSEFDVHGLLGTGNDRRSSESLAGYADDYPDDYDATVIDHTLDTEAENFIDASLHQMGVINNTLFDYEQAGLEKQTELRSAHRQTLVTAYAEIAREAAACESAELSALAEANIRLLESGNDSKNAQTLLEESVAVLPQLINQMHSSSDKVHGLQALLDQLSDAAVEDITLAMDVQNILSQTSTTENTGVVADDDPATELLDETINPDALNDESSFEATTVYDHTATLAGTVAFGKSRLLDDAADEHLDETLNVSDADLAASKLPDTSLSDDASLSYDEWDETRIDAQVPPIGENDRADESSLLAGTSIISDHSDVDEHSATQLETIAFETEALDDDIRSPLDLQSDLQGDSTRFDDTDDAPVMTLDNTLEQVFFRECDQHMLSLRKSVADALSSNEWDVDTQRAALNLSIQKAGVEVPAVAAAAALPNRELLRALHTLTGSAQTVDAQGIIAIAQPLQKAALHKQRNGEKFNRAETEYIGELLEILQGRLDAMEANRVFVDDDAAVMARLNEFVTRSEPWVPERKSGLQLDGNVSSIESVFEEEARELLESLRTESYRLSDEDVRKDAINQILSRLHTIKGSARMAGQSALADRAHQLEDEIRLADGVALDEAVFNGLSELQTLMLVETPVVAAVKETPHASEPMGLTEATFENMLSLATRASVSQAKLGESILRLREASRDIESTSARLQRLPHDNVELNSAAVAEMLSDLDSAQRMLADALLDAEAEHTQGARADASLHQTLIRAQLVSFSESHTRLQHAANDAARETGKQVEFILSGADVNVDKATYRKLMTPLEHLIRNAVVHGVEAEAERGAAGKSMQGQVNVDAKIDGTDLLFEVGDDGVGIQLDGVKDKTTGTVSTDKLLDILCEPGFSTHESVDQLSGRGLGLSTVRQLVDELDGSLQLRMPTEGGSVFSLRIPQKIRINQVVLVEHQGSLFAIPVNFIHTVSDEQHDLSQADIQFNGNDYQCCSLDAIVNGDIANVSGSSGTRVILLGIHDKHIALMVDKVLGYREIIAQPLGAQLVNLKRYLGGGVLADGRAVLIPDFNRLLSPGARLPVSNWSAANAPVIARTALIVDDSITMRIAAEQMLQNIGIMPSMARDGAEAVELVSAALPDVLLVDIDMPRMNGFDFLEHLRVLYPEHATPVVMISTRDSNEDREKAFGLGATHYLVKPYTEKQLHTVLKDTGLNLE